MQLFVPFIEGNPKLHPHCQTPTNVPFTEAFPIRDNLAFGRNGIIKKEAMLDLLPGFRPTQV
jgi:hypothetical protein